jgi:tetratricopeptide (TPR) repeat protein
MHEERDALCRFVFPFLEDFCSKRNTGFIGIDLRWGVTEEDVRQGKTIRLCFNEIDNCRPYFLGILGERYGWVPEKALTGGYEHLFCGDASITEAEMLYGALNETGNQTTKAFFCLRNPASTHPSTPNPLEKEQTAGRLHSLKQRIRNSRYPVLDGYSSIRDFCTFVKEQLCRAIEEDFPMENETSGEYEREAASHACYAHNLNNIFTGHNSALADVDAYMETELNHPLFVSGAPGTGKTAFLARWSVRRQEACPDDFIFTHFYGASIYSDQWESLAKRLIYELCQKFHLTFDLPDSSGKLANALHDYLYMASKKGKNMILVIDGVDLINTDKTFGLAWLPKDLPAHVQMILSVKTENGRKNLLRRNYKEYPLPLLKYVEQKSLIASHLAPYGKKLDERYIAQALKMKAAKNPLYLRVLLHELCTRATHDRMDKLLTYYLQAQSVKELFAKMIEMCEIIYDEEKSGLTRNMLSLLWGARYGLTENELLDILNIPQATFSPLYHALKPYLVNKNGILDFAFVGLQDAVRQYCLPSAKEQNDVRKRLADYFLKNRQTSLHAIEELPWLLEKTASWGKLYLVMCNTDKFSVLWKRNPSEIKMYWEKIESKTKKHRTEAYRLTKQQLRRTPKQTVWELAAFFSETGYPEEAERLLSYLTDMHPSQKNREIRLRTFRLLGNLLHTAGRHHEAKACYERIIALCRKTGNELELSRTLGNIGLLKYSDGYPEEALLYYEKAERVCREAGFVHGIQSGLGNQGDACLALGKPDRAEDLFRKQEQLCRESGHLPGLVAALGNLGVLAIGQKDYNRAMQLFTEQEAICNQIGDLNQLQLVYGNRAVALYESGEKEKAMKLLENKQQLCAKINNFSGMETALYNLAHMCFENGDKEKALTLCRERTALCRQHKAALPFADSLYHCAVVQLSCGQEAEAEKNLQMASTLAQTYQAKELYMKTNELLIKIRRNEK